jgi:YbbR domain-containing protein
MPRWLTQNWGYKLLSLGLAVLLFLYTHGDLGDRPRLPSQVSPASATAP